MAAKLGRRKFLRGLVGVAGAVAATVMAPAVAVATRFRWVQAEDYVLILHPRQAAVLKGEIGRYEAVRFIESSKLPSDG